MAAEGPKLEIEELHERIDRLVSGPLVSFLENRTSLIDALGMGAYARIMSSFSPGERALNRAWSAATDGYRNEVLASVAKAAEAFERTRKELETENAPGS